MDEQNATRNDSVRPTSLRGEGGSAPPPVQLGVYRIQGRLGQGGMGTVYRAWHTRLKRPVALKTLRGDCMDNIAAVARFHREMEAIGKLDHPNLIRATDAGEDHGIHFLAMEFVEGVDASKLSARHGPLTPADACEVVRQAAIGLQYVHEHHLVHRDIKPSNLMMTTAGQVKILDLGLALLHAGPSEAGELTESNQWMGTADYMAPEQGLDAHGVDIRADVYSLGCTLYKLLSGRAPFGGSEYNTPYKKMDAHAHRSAPPLRDSRPDLPGELTVLVERMMAKSPEDRFATPGDVADALTAFTAGSDLARLVSAASMPAPPPPETPAAGSLAAETGSFGPITVVPMLSPAEPLPASTLVSRPVGRRWWAMGAVLAIAGLAALAVVFWPRTPKGPRELTPGKWHNVLDRPPVPLLWPAGAFPPQFDDNQQQLLVNCDSPALLRLGTIPDGVHYKIEIGFRQPRWIGGVGLFFGYQQRADRTTFQQILLVPAGSNKSQFRLSRSRGEMTVIDGEPFPMIHGLFTQDVRPLGPQESRLEIEVGKAGPLHRVRWNGDELHTLTHPQAAESTRDCSYHGDFGIAMEKSSAVITTARVLVFEKGN